MKLRRHCQRARPSIIVWDCSLSAMLDRPNGYWSGTLQPSRQSTKPVRFSRFLWPGTGRGRPPIGDPPQLRGSRRPLIGTTGEQSGCLIAIVPSYSATLPICQEQNKINLRALDLLDDLVGAGEQRLGHGQA